MSGYSNGDMAMVQTPEKASRSASHNSPSRSTEELQRDPSLKRKKWLKSLSVVSSDEEDLGEDEGVGKLLNLEMYSKESLSLRFPYVMISDDSDEVSDDEYLSWNPGLPNKDCIDKNNTLGLYAKGKSEIQKQNKSYKHKKRKLNNKGELLVPSAEIISSGWSKTIKKPKVVKNTEFKYKSNLKNSSRVQDKDVEVVKKSRPSNNFKKRCASNKLSHNTRRKIEKVQNPKKTSSRLLESSSEEEIISQKTYKRKNFRRLQVLSSNSSCSSYDEELADKTCSDYKNKLSHNTRRKIEKVQNPKKTSSRLLESSSEEEIISQKTYKRQNFRRLQVLSNSSSCSSYDEESADKTCSDYKNSNVPPKVSSKDDDKSIIPSVSQSEYKEYPFNQTQLNSGNVQEKRLKSNSNFNGNVWKNLANVKLKRPKTTSSQQSYLKTLKKQFINSNASFVQLQKQLKNKTFTKEEDKNELKNESCSKLNIMVDDPAFGKKENVSQTIAPQSFINSSTKKSAEDISSFRSSTNDKGHQPVDVNFNMNLQIICSSSLTGSNGDDHSKTPIQFPEGQKNKGVPTKLDFSLSLTHNDTKENKKLTVKKTNLCQNKKYRNMLKSNSLNKLKRKITPQNQVQTDIQERSTVEEDSMNRERRTITNNNDSHNLPPSASDSNENRNDVLGNILEAMDKNPFKVQRVVNAKPVEPTLENLYRNSENPNLYFPVTQSHVFLPVTNPTLNPKKGNEELGKYINQVERTNPLSKEDDVSVDLMGRSLLIPQPGPTINKNCDLNEFPQEVSEIVIPSFYSVNSEDYNYPEEFINNETKDTHANAEQIMCNVKHNISESTNEICSKNRKTIETSQLTENKESHSETVVNFENSFHKTISSPLVTIQHNNDTNCMQMTAESQSESTANVHSSHNRPNYANVSCKVNVITKNKKKNKPNAQKKKISRIQKLNRLKRMKKNTKPTRESLVVSRESKESGPDQLNICEVGNGEIKKVFAIENNDISNNTPSKGIRIRFGGNVYRMPGKENVSNIVSGSVNAPEENFLKYYTDIKNQVYPNSNSKPNICNSSNVFYGVTGTENKSGKNSSSSEDSSNDSSSSDSDEDRPDSEKSSSETSSSEGSTKGNSEEEEKAIQNIIPINVLSAESEIGLPGAHIDSDKSNALMSSKNDNGSVFSLDKSLEILFNNQENVNLPKEIPIGGSNDVIVLSSSSESEDIEVTDRDVCKTNDTEKKYSDILEKNKSSDYEIFKKEKDQDVYTKNNGNNITTKNSNDSVQNKFGRIRVKSLKELGVQNVNPLPDNALEPSSSVADSSNVNHKSQVHSHQNAVNIAQPSSSTKSDSNSITKSKTTSLQGGKVSLSLSKSANKSNIRLVAPLSSEFHINKQVQEPTIQVSSSGSVSSKSTPIVDKITPNRLGTANKHKKTFGELSFKSNTLGCKRTQSITGNNNPSSGNEPTSQNTTTASPLTLNFIGIPVTNNTISIPKGTPFALVQWPTSNILDSQPRTSSSSNNGIEQAANKEESSNKTPNSSNKIGSVQDSFFFKLFDELFSEVFYFKLPKLVDDLHLVINHDIMREERLKKVQQLKCLESKTEEKKRTEKEFLEMLRVRGQSFVPLFMTIVKKIEKENLKTLVIAVYCKMIHQLERIDPLNCNYRLKLRFLIQKMLKKSSIRPEICFIFDENNINFIANFRFIENLLLKYDQYLKNQRFEEVDKSSEENTQTSENKLENAQVSDSQISLPVEPSVTPTFPIGNLDQMLLSSFFEKYKETDSTDKET